MNMTGTKPALTSNEAQNMLKINRVTVRIPPSELKILQLGQFPQQSAVHKGKRRWLGISLNSNTQQLLETEDRLQDFADTSKSESKNNLA